MIAVVQRVSSASVTIDGVCSAEIGTGLLILIGVRKGDTEADASYLASKCTGLRIFEDAAGKMNLSTAAVNGSLLIVTNFTLYGNCVHGRRPSFEDAERPERAKPLTDLFIAECAKSGLPVQQGVFGADMKVALVNDGPVTLIIDSAARTSGSASGSEER